MYPFSSNDVALVTGAGSKNGIGFSIASLLAECGTKVAITATTPRIWDRLSELPTAENNKTAFVADLTIERQVKDLINHVEVTLGKINILINCAGMTQLGKDDDMPLSLLNITKQRWDKVLDRNLTTSFLTTRAALPHMFDRGYGRIIFITSVTGPVAAYPGASDYGAAKAGLTGMMRSLALEVADKNLTVNAIAPGWIETDSSTAAETGAGRNTPIGRSGTPREVAQVALFLASPGASYLTGQMVVVDGGNSIQEIKGT